MRDRTSGDRMPTLNRHPVVPGVVAVVIKAAGRVPAGGWRQKALAGRHRVTGVLPLRGINPLKEESGLFGEAGGCGRNLPVLVLTLNTATTPTRGELLHEATTSHHTR